jgi:gamma-glutamylcyclotransferase (GGCT)/AIG2-like uncharacterized protein YtfP
MAAKFRYFGYGSNTNLDDLQARPRVKSLAGDVRDWIKPVGRATLADYELAFDYHSDTRQGRALNLRSRRGSVVEGMLYEVSAKGWKLLDYKEGVSRECYRRLEVGVVRPSGEAVAATTYIACDHRIEPDHVEPSEEYLSVVRAGYASAGLCCEPLEAAARGETGHSEIDGVFVYGTLMRGMSRFDRIRPFVPECALLAHASGRLVDCGGWPGLVPPRDRGDLVAGEFLRIHRIADALGCLDEIEDFRGCQNDGSLFRRTLTTVDVGDGRLRRAWVYGLAAGLDEASPIPSGDWRAHRGCRETFLAELAAAHAAAGGGEEAIARRLAGEVPFAMGGTVEVVAAQLMPLARALADGSLSERRLAQQSGRWAVIP